MSHGVPMDATTAALGQHVSALQMRKFGIDAAIAEEEARLKDLEDRKAAQQREYLVLMKQLAELESDAQRADGQVAREAATLDNLQQRTRAARHEEPQLRALADLSRNEADAAKQHVISLKERLEEAAAASAGVGDDDARDLQSVKEELGSLAVAEAALIKELHELRDAEAQRRRMLELAQDRAAVDAAAKAASKSSAVAAAAAASSLGHHQQASGDTPEALRKKAAHAEAMHASIRGIMTAEAERGAKDLEAAEAEVATAKEQTEAAEAWIADVEDRISALDWAIAAMKKSIANGTCASCNVADAEASQT